MDKWGDGDVCYHTFVISMTPTMFYPKTQTDVPACHYLLSHPLDLFFFLLRPPTTLPNKLAPLAREKYHCISQGAKIKLVSYTLWGVDFT